MAMIATTAWRAATAALLTALVLTVVLTWLGEALGGTLRLQTPQGAQTGRITVTPPRRGDPRTPVTGPPAARLDLYDRHGRRTGWGRITPSGRVDLYEAPSGRRMGSGTILDR